MGRSIELSCFLLFLVCFTSQHTASGNDLNSRKLDLIFLIHTSNQITDRSFELIKTFLYNLLRDCDIDSGDVRVGIAFYDGENTSILFNLPQYNNKADVITAIGGISPRFRSDSADLARGLRTVDQIMLSARNDERSDVPNAVVVITDSTSSVDMDIIRSAAEDLKRKSYIFGVAIGIFTFNEMAQIVTRPPNVNYFGIVAIERLHEVEPQLTEQIMALQGDAAPLDNAVDKKSDIIFLIHMSKRATKIEQNQLKAFIQDLLSSADIDSGDVRVAIVTYNINSKVVMNFDTYTRKNELFRAINSMNKFKGAKANAAAGLKVVNNKVLIDKSGDRPNVKNTLILISDQESVRSQNSKRNADKVRGKGTDIYSIGVGFDTSPEFREISNKPAGVHAQFVSDFSRLSDAKDLLLQSIPSFGVQATPVRPTAPPPPIDNTVYRTTTRRTTTTTTTTTTTSAPTRPTAPPTRYVPPTAPTTPRRELPDPSGGRCGPARSDIVFLIDSSASVSAINFQKMLLFIKDLLYGADIESDVRVGLLTYNGEVSIRFHLNRYTTRDSLEDAILRVPYDAGSTNTAGALRVMRTEMFVREKGDRLDVPNIAVVLTDGVSNINSNLTRIEAKTAHRDGIQIYAIGIGLVDTRELNGIASRPLPKYRLTVEEFDELKYLGRKIFQKYCPVTTPVVSPVPTPRQSETGQDVVLMLDSSVSQDNLFRMLIFARAFVGMADMNSGKVRIGVMFFSDDAKVEAHLNSNQRQEELLQIIDMLPQTAGKSNKAKAFNEVRRNMFTVENGDRPKADNKVIIVTSSKTTDLAKAEKRMQELQREANAEIFVLGFGNAPTRQLYSFASPPKPEHVYMLNNPATIPNVIQSLRERVERVYVPPTTTTTTTTTPAPTTRRRTRPPPPTRPPTPPTRPTPTTRRRITTTRPPVITTPRRPVVTTPRRVYKPSDCTSRADILFIIDSSGSVGEENFGKVIDFVYSTVDTLDIESGLYNVALITFSDTARTEFYLNSFNTKQEIENATAAVKYVYGSTHTAIALRMARTRIFSEVNGDRPDSPNIAIIITDGQSNINNIQTLPQARLLKESGVSVITVAVGFATQTEELIGMTSPPVAENLFSVDGFNNLKDLHDKIVEPICKGKHLCQNNPCKNGGKCYDTLKHFICICPKGYYGDECDKVCPQPADVAFILDSSSSVGWRTFQHMKRFAANMVRDLAVSNCGHRIGLVKYSSRPLIEFPLDQYDTQGPITHRIDYISYTRGHADMANAIRFVREQMFSPRYGDRDGVKNIAYLLTHGQIDLSRETTLREAELAISSGIHLIPVAFNARKSYELDTIAAAQGIKTTEILGSADMADMSVSLLNPIFETESHCEPNPCLNDGTCVNYPFTYKCHCKRGFTGENCEKQCNSRADVVLVIDTSRYVSRSRLRIVKQMLRRTIKRLSFSQQNVRVSVVAYDANPRLLLTLEEGQSKQTVLAAISMLRPRRTDPRPGAALQRVNQDVLQAKYGDRLNVPNYLILVTKSTRDIDEMLVQSRNLKMKGTRIIAVGLVSSTSSAASSLNDVVSLPLDQNKFIIANNTREEHIADIVQQLASTVCYEGICANTNCLNGGTCVIDQGSSVCDCPRGFSGRWCQNPCDKNADVVFVLDTSGNISPSEFRLMKEFAIEMTEQLSIGSRKTRVAAITYNNRARMGFTLNAFSSAHDVRNALSSLLYEYGNANAVSALELVRAKIFNYKTGDRPDTKNFVIFLSNTESKFHNDRISASAKALRRYAHIFAIGIGNYNFEELKSIASLPSLLNVYRAHNYEELFNFTGAITYGFCKASTFCDSNPCQNNGVCEPESTTFRCTCAEGYAGRFCERRCQIKKDIAFVLDSSSSVGDINFGRMLAFTSKLVDDLADRNMRYALITYSNDATLVFSFSRYKDAESVASIIKRTPYKPGSTNTASALANAADIFSPDYGSRVNSEKVVILITDGMSNVNDHLTIPNAQMLKARVDKVMAIGVGLDNMAEINQIASSDRFVYTVQDFTLLTDVENDIVGDTCLIQNDREDVVYREVGTEVVSDIEVEDIEGDDGGDIEGEYDRSIS